MSIKSKLVVQSHILSRIMFHIVALLFCFITSPQLFAQSVDDKQINELISKFNTLSTTIYKYYTDSKAHKFVDIRILEENVRKLEQKNHVSSIILIKNNIDLIKENIDDKSIFYFISILLKHFEWNTAHALFRFINSDGEKSLISNVNFSFSKYYLEQNNWQASADLLTDVFDDLADEDANYAYLIKGIALQHLKKHRIAIDFYKNISKKSTYYTYAQLNMAIAYIRQGWWTEAHLLINELLKNNNIIKSDAISNRLYLVLGYSLLQKEYYRDSREAFRKIALSSQYANRALLGIALTAANQGDHIGALNALSILKNKNTTDLSVDESYLLIPYVYVKIKQNMTASASYNEAMSYYGKRIQNINTLLIKKDSLYSLADFNKGSGQFTLNNNIIDFTKTYPVSFVDNLYSIQALIKHVSNSKNKTEKKFKFQLINLQKQYELMLSNMLHNLLSNRKEYLNSYINQCRYGLARLYDNTTTENK